MGERRLNVLVHIEDPNPKSPKFLLVCPQLTTLPGTKHDFFFENYGDDDEGFLLQFILVGNAHGYFFPDDKLEALYSRKGQGCPDEPDQWPQFRAKEVKPGNKILVVRNMNQPGEEAEFGYTLRVTKRPHETNLPDDQFLNLDPGGLNGNGGYGRKKTSAATFAVAIGAGIVSALVTVFSLVGLGIIR